MAQIQLNDAKCYTKIHSNQKHSHQEQKQTKITYSHKWHQTSYQSVNSTSTGIHISNTNETTKLLNGGEGG